MSERNQCDGCRRERYVTEGLHAWKAGFGLDATLCGEVSQPEIPGRRGGIANVGETVTCKACQRLISHCQIHFTTAYKARS